MSVLFALPNAGSVSASQRATSSTILVQFSDLRVDNIENVGSRQTQNPHHMRNISAFFCPRNEHAEGTPNKLKNLFQTEVHFFDTCNRSIRNLYPNLWILPILCGDLGDVLFQSWIRVFPTGQFVSFWRRKPSRGRQIPCFPYFSCFYMFAQVFNYVTNVTM